MCNYNIHNVFITIHCNIQLRLVVAQGHKRVTVDETGCGFDSHSRKLNMKCFHFSCYNNEAFSPPLNTQCLQKTLERGERESVLMGMES